MAIAENSLPPKTWEVHLCKFYTQKYGFQVKFQTQKHGKHTPYANMASTPWEVGLIYEMTKFVCKSWTPKQHDHSNHAQGSILVHSSGTQGAKNYRNSRSSK